MIRFLPPLELKDSRAAMWRLDFCALPTSSSAGAGSGGATVCELQLKMLNLPKGGCRDRVVRGGVGAL